MSVLQAPMVHGHWLRCLARLMPLGILLQRGGAVTTNNNIVHTANTDSFQESQAGTYFIGCYVYLSAITAGPFQLIGRYSTNGTAWNNVLVSTGAGASLQGTTIAMQGIDTMAKDSFFDIVIYNATTGTVTLTATLPNSYFYMYRIG